MKSSSRIVVIGAGIVGSAIAFQLTRRHRNVTVIDAGRPGAGATYASYAWINSRDKSPREYHDLNRRSLDMWPRFAQDLHADIGLRWGGEMRWSATDDGARALTEHAEELRSWGYPIVEVTRELARAMEPGIVMEPFTAAVYCGIEGHVDTQKVVRAAMNQVQKAGGEVISNDAVASLTLEDAGEDQQAISSVGLSSGREIECETVVLAAGYETTAVAAMAGIEFPQRRSPGATVVTEPLSPIFRKIVCMHTPRDLQESLMNVRQFADGSVMIHGGTHDGSVGDSSDEDAEALVGKIAGYIPLLANAKLKQVRHGMRPMPEDGFPVIGYSGRVPNLYFSVMHSGVTLAALTGEFASTEILDGARIDILAGYRPDRFSA